jgi:MFS family permease
MIHSDIRLAFRLRKISMQTRSTKPVAVKPAAPAPDLPWYRAATAEQWNVLLAAMLGWMLDAMDFVLYLMAITTLQSEFHFGTETAGLLASVALLTSSAGGMLFGVLSDRIGRARALMGTILIYSICSLGTATSLNLTHLIIWRAALGLGMGGEWSSGAVLVSETWPAEHRGKAIGMMQSGWAIGYILAALIAAVVLPRFGWRWLFVTGVLPALLVFWIRRKIKEPRLWSADTDGPRVSTLSPLKAIFGPGLAAKTVMATLMTGLVMFGYWGLFSWLPAFLATPIEQHGAGMSVVRSVGWIVAVQVGAFFGYASFGFVSDRIGRRPAFVIYLFSAAVLAPIYGSLSGRPHLLLLLGPLLGFFGHGYFSLFGAMLAEIFPTAIRGTGQGFTYNTGRALSAFAPFTIGALARRSGIGPALTLTSAFFVMGALMVFLMPETRGKKFER